MGIHVKITPDVNPKPLEPVIRGRNKSGLDAAEYSARIPSRIQVLFFRDVSFFETKPNV
jgi:hypothetical protein